MKLKKFNENFNDERKFYFYQSEIERLGVQQLKLGIDSVLDGTYSSIDFKGVNPNQIIEYFNELGAKQLDSTGWEVEWDKKYEINGSEYRLSGNMYKGWIAFSKIA